MKNNKPTTKEEVELQYLREFFVKIQDLDILVGLSKGTIVDVHTARELQGTLNQALDEIRERVMVVNLIKEAKV